MNALPGILTGTLYRAQRIGELFNSSSSNPVVTFKYPAIQTILRQPFFANSSLNIVSPIAIVQSAWHILPCNFSDVEKGFSQTIYNRLWQKGCSARLPDNNNGTAVTKLSGLWTQLRIKAGFRLTSFILNPRRKFLSSVSIVAFSSIDEITIPRRHYCGMYLY